MKNLFVLVAIAILAFIVGFFIAENRYNQKPEIIKSNEKNSEKELIGFFDYTKNNLEDLISVNPENSASIRNKLTDIVFGTSQLPQQMPDSVSEITDKLYSNISNLKTIEQFKIIQKYNIQSIGYIFNPKKNNNRLFIYHQGHNGDFILGKHVIEYFVNKGFTVYAFSMPLFGKNNDPVVTIDNIGTFKLTDENMESHELMKFLDNPLSFFAAPVVTMINYAQSENFEDITMCGISGGGWTTTLVSAIDTRINYSFPVAGTYPMYIKLNSPIDSYGDFEQIYPALYKNVSYMDMYILAATGKNRFQIQVLNRHDPCCFQGTYFKHYEPFIIKKVNNFEYGSFEVISDTNNLEHKVSKFSLGKIFEKLNNIQ